MIQTHSASSTADSYKQLLLFYNKAILIINGFMENSNPWPLLTGLQRHPQTIKMLQIEINHYFWHFIIQPGTTGSRVNSNGLIKEVRNG